MEAFCASINDYSSENSSGRTEVNVEDRFKHSFAPVLLTIQVGCGSG
jgi:hypothetical protein